MIRTFIDQHRRLIIWLASSLLIILVLLNSLWFFSQVSEANPAAPDNPVLSLPNGELLASGDTQSGESGTAWLPILVSVGGMLLFAGALASFNLIMIKRARHRDDRRRQDLALITEAFEAYYDGYGHYPLSSSYEEGYFTAITLTNEWQHYDMPAAEVMQTYLPKWPISDPSISISDPDQRGNYLYYPQKHGQSFRLYAVLERHQGPKTVAEQDGLPEELAYYNLRQESRRGQASVEDAGTHFPKVEAVETAGVHGPEVGDTPVLTPTNMDNDLRDLLPKTQTAPVAAPSPAQASMYTFAPIRRESLPTSPVATEEATNEDLPIIQSSTLPLDVRLAQGSAVAMKPESASAESSAAETVEPLQKISPSPTNAVAPRRQLTFAPSESRLDTQLPSPSPAPAAEESTETPPAAHASIPDLPPLFFESEDDLR